MTQGYSNGALYRYTAGGGSNVEVNTVTQTNSGQITEYPYKIDETFTCATTHAQYYQLDMEADDIVVWYCLGGSNYANNPNDARNNYYIYNRGNITYSGVGHRGGLTDTEVKLFVNTMVAAYNASATQPKITLTNADKVAMGDVDALYINYDYAGAVGMDLNDFIQRNVDISYKMIENNLLSNKKVKVKYYLLQGKKWDATTKSFTDEVVFASEDELLANTYYKTYTKPSGDVIRIDPHVLLSTTTKEVEDGTIMSVSDGAASIKSNTEYYFNYEVLKEKPDGSMDLESLFEDSHYIPLEIEITMTYGKRQDKEIVVRKPIILYRRALFDLD